MIPIPLKVDDLRVDLENPRYPDAAPDDRAAILEMLQNQGPKLVALAEHIAEFGLSPIELTLVYPVDDGKYVVAEGNRRTAALKILLDPTLIHGGDPKLVKKLKAVAEKVTDVPTEILCVIMQSEADRTMWVKLRHTGENQGRGLSEWSAKEQARFMSRHDQDRTVRMEFGLHVVQLVQARARLNSQEEDALRVIPITTLERMLGDPAVRNALGIERSGDGVKIVVDDEEQVISALKELVLEIAFKRVKVGQLMSKEDRQEQVSQWAPARKPGLSAEPAPPRIIALHANVTSGNRSTAAQGTTSRTGTTPTPPVQTSSGTARSSLPRSPDKRNVLIPPIFSIKITDPRIKRIYIELKKLYVEEYGNAVSVLLRVFLELSVEAYLTRNSVTYVDTEKLRKKMEKVADHWEAQRILTRSQLTVWRNAAGSHALFSLNTLHSYVHSSQAIPTKRDLIRTWDAMEMYFKQLWP